MNTITLVNGSMPFDPATTDPKHYNDQCPWCGAIRSGVEDRTDYVSGKVTHRIACKCGACGPWGDSPNEAIERWRSRP